MLRDKSVIRSSRAIVKRRKRRIVHLVVLCLCSLILFFGSAYISFSPKFLIADISTLGNVSVSGEDVQGTVEKIVSGKYLGLFSKRNIWLYPEENVIETIKNNFPQVASVSLANSDTKDLVVYISEREPRGVWCGDAELKVCYFLDENGFIFGEAPQFTGTIYTTFTGVIEKENPIKESYLPQKDFLLLQGFIENLKRFGFVPVRIHLSTSGDGYVLLPGEGKILFTFGPDISKSAENLEAFLSESPVVLKNGGLKGQYIDIRFGNKIFYKE